MSACHELQPVHTSILNYNMYVYFIPHFFVFSFQIMSSPTLYTIFFVTWASSIAAWRPCPELSPLLKFPCKCNLETQSSNPDHLELSIDCDGIVFNDDQPQFPYGAPIISYTQRNSGQQKLSLQVTPT